MREKKLILFTTDKHYTKCLYLSVIAQKDGQKFVLCELYRDKLSVNLLTAKHPEKKKEMAFAILF